MHQVTQTQPKKGNRHYLSAVLNGLWHGVPCSFIIFSFTCFALLCWLSVAMPHTRYSTDYGNIGLIIALCLYCIACITIALYDVARQRHQKGKSTDEEPIRTASIVAKYIWLGLSAFVGIGNIYFWVGRFAY